ncbi:MAG: cobyrinate a,c-diamide synthase [Deltaproteobacteria bacterium]|nr:MAG: cobyrinate a,c-diamide synthase [Deltaproteobacteria bacterium]
MIESNKRIERLPNTKCMVIAGTHSGVGKTTISLGLMAAFQKKGLRVQGFKVGPDFIDPGHHTRLLGMPSRNLDGWMLSERYNRATFSQAMDGKDLGIVEGVMGLYDGYDGRSEAGSTAQMAKWLGAPVVLVVDASSMARSIGALAHGFTTFDRNLHLAAVIANRVGSPTHARFLAEAMDSVPEVAFLGGIPRTEDVAIPERYLGLVTSDEQPYSADLFDTMALLVEEHLDLDTLLSISTTGVRNETLDLPKPLHSRVRLGVARDEAFCFYYQDNLDLLSHFGAELCFFSPIRDQDLPDDVAGLYLGGGYPELYARQLGANESMKSAILASARRGMPIYAECGGFMYLTRSIEVEAQTYGMVGLYPVGTRMLSKRKALGYREVLLKEHSLLGPKGLRARGHEYHYSELIDDPGEIPDLFQVSDRMGVDTMPDGFMLHNVLAGYIHLHFGSNPETAANLVDSCKKYRDEK